MLIFFLNVRIKNKKSTNFAKSKKLHVDMGAVQYNQNEYFSSN